MSAARVLLAVCVAGLALQLGHVTPTSLYSPDVYGGIYGAHAALAVVLWTVALVEFAASMAESDARRRPHIWATCGACGVVFLTTVMVKWPGVRTPILPTRTDTR